jgi:hypothetical protein
MPWWSWILLWIALIAVSLLFYVLLGIRLFRQFTATVRELGEAGDRFGHLAPPRLEGDSEPDGAGNIAGWAVFASPLRVRHDYLAAKASRKELRRQRRVKRKAERGQPQSLHDIDFS